MQELELKNAVIKNVDLRIDEGVLSSWLYLDYGGTGQDFGGFALYLPKSFTHHAIESYAGHWIFRVMEIAGVEKWHDIPGKAIRVKASWGGVEEIGHIIKDDWFNPRKDFAKLNDKNTGV